MATYPLDALKVVLIAVVILSRGSISSVRRQAVTIVGAHLYTFIFYLLERNLHVGDPSAAPGCCDRQLFCFRNR